MKEEPKGEQEKKKMITNEEVIEKYKEDSKIYIPEEMINDNYKYLIDSGDNITIITNKNCYTNYNTEYCDCYKYNIRHNIISKGNACNRNQTNGLISNEYITNDINNSERITRDYVNNYEISFLILISALILVSIFKRNSRNM